MSIREITPNFHIFGPKYNISHRFPSFLIAFAQICPLLLPYFPNCFCPNVGKSNGKFGQNQWEIRAKPMGTSGKTNGKVLAKAMRKLGKRRHIFRAKTIAFARISHCFCSNIPWLLPEFPTAFARIFRFQKIGGGGHSAPLPPPPPPPTPMHHVLYM